MSEPVDYVTERFTSGGPGPEGQPDTVVESQDTAAADPTAEPTADSTPEPTVEPTAEPVDGEPEAPAES